MNPRCPLAGARGDAAAVVIEVRDHETNGRDLRPAGQGAALVGLLLPALQAAPPGRVYEHKESGSIIILPAFDLSERVYAHHLLTVQTDLDNFGVADPSVFAAKLQKTG